MLQDITQEQQQTSPALDQDQSRAALAVVTYLMTHTLPPAKMQSQAQPDQQVQQETKQTQKPTETQQPDKTVGTSELKGQMDGMKTENDAKIKSIVESQQKQIDELKQLVQQALEQPEQQPNGQSQAPTNL